MDDRKSFYLEVGHRIRKARKAIPLTQEALASLVSLTRTSITNIEKGRQNFPLHTLADIAAALKVPAADLLPKPSFGSNVELDTALRDRPSAEKTWIKSALGSARKE